MLELKFQCQDTAEAQHLLNAQQYYNLISDFTQAVRSARKHGTDEDVVRVVENFYSDFLQACDHCEGPY
jgi:transcription elongation factor Elf1